MSPPHAISPLDLLGSIGSVVHVYSTTIIAVKIIPKPFSSTISKQRYISEDMFLDGKLYQLILALLKDGAANVARRQK